ncbi:MAG TPA: XRE family transcriptional regulator [Verrucomicrobiae bacterium]|nr:XRE family transcriptional regulator [Verrucomicrobiae bacterium]
MKEEASDLTRRIAERLRQLRATRRFSLDILARRSGVSRSMISLIERGESSPTAVVLDKLAASLGVAMASLFDAPAIAAEPNKGPVARRAEQAQWRDPASGYLRRVISPPGVRQPVQIIEVLFPPRARVAFEASRRDSHVHQQVWVLEGEIEIASDAERYRLREGDCPAMQLERPKMFYNPTRKTTRYAIVVATEPSFEQ